MRNLAHVITPRGHLVPIHHRVIIRPWNRGSRPRVYVVETLIRGDQILEPLCACETREEAVAALAAIAYRARDARDAVVRIADLGLSLDLIADQLEEWITP